MNPKYEMLVKERSIVAAKDASIITFFQKLKKMNSDVARLITNKAKAKLIGGVKPFICVRLLLDFVKWQQKV